MMTLDFRGLLIVAPDIIDPDIIAFAGYVDDMLFAMVFVVTLVVAFVMVFVVTLVMVFVVTLVIAFVMVFVVTLVVTLVVAFVMVFVITLVMVFVVAFVARLFLFMAPPARGDKEDFGEVYRNKGAFGDFQSAPVTEGACQLNEDEFIATFKSSVMMMSFVYFTEECSGQPHQFVTNYGIKHYRYDHAACKVEAFASGEFHILPSL